MTTYSKAFQEPGAIPKHHMIQFFSISLFLQTEQKQNLLLLKTKLV